MKYISRPKEPRVKMNVCGAAVRELHFKNRNNQMSKQGFFGLTNLQRPQLRHEQREALLAQLLQERDLADQVRVQRQSDLLTQEEQDIEPAVATTEGKPLCARTSATAAGCLARRTRFGASTRTFRARKRAISAEVAEAEKNKQREK
jgi:hypothetical protein